MAKEIKEVDIFRDTYVRYLGYANEVGEAFRSIIAKNLVRFSYIVAIGYVVADSSHKAAVVYKLIILINDYPTSLEISTGKTELCEKNNNELNTTVMEPSPNKIKRVVLSASDTLIWQGFASVIIPGLTINRICYTVQFVQKKLSNKKLKSPWVSVAVGLVSIPFIIRPIDVFVEDGMNVTYRKWIGYNPNEAPD